jgi:hypothetical protein
MSVRFITILTTLHHEHYQKLERAENFTKKDVF